MKYLLSILLLGTLLISCETNPPTPAEPVVKAVPKPSNTPEKIQFPSLDGLPITAHLYENKSDAPVILLCHQARFNKTEYTKIAPALHKKGFTCLAIDQRSGGPMIETFNETLLEANKKGLPVEYLDAEQDMLAAIDYAAKKYHKNIILWGSSYSSTLALHIACEHKKVDAVIAFSPGNYFDEQKGALKEKLMALEIPMWVTSSKEEAPDLTALLDPASLKTNQLQFIPTAEGKHGSKALWKTHENNAEYWESINNFLNSIHAPAANTK